MNTSSLIEENNKITLAELYWDLWEKMKTKYPEQEDFNYYMGKARLELIKNFKEN
jgi:hypothetical protein